MPSYSQLNINNHLFNLPCNLETEERCHSSCLFPGTIFLSSAEGSKWDYIHLRGYQARLTAHGLSCHSYQVELCGSVRRGERLPCSSRKAALVGTSIWERAERSSARMQQMDFAFWKCVSLPRVFPDLLCQGVSIRQAMNTGKLSLSLSANQESLPRVKLSIQNPFRGSVRKNSQHQRFMSK